MLAITEEVKIKELCIQSLLRHTMQEENDLVIMIEY